MYPKQNLSSMKYSGVQLVRKQDEEVYTAGRNGWDKITG